MNKYSSFLIVIFGVIGCSSEVAVRNHSHKKGGWKGVFVTSPEEVEQLKGEGFVELHFFPSGHAQFSVTDRKFPEFRFFVLAETEREGSDKLKVVCKSVAGFSVSELKEGLSNVVYVKRRGVDALFSGSGEINERFKQFYDKSKVLDELLPPPLRGCEEQKILLGRIVKQDAEVRIQLMGGETPLELVNYYSSDFTPLVDRLPILNGSLKLWKGSSKFPSLLGSLVYEDSSNTYLPLPQTHSFYVPFSLKMGENGSAYDDSRKGVNLLWKQGKRPDMKIEKNENPFWYFQVEHGRWYRLKPITLTLRVAENRRDFCRVSVKEGDISFEDRQIFVDLAGRALEKGVRYSLEVEYESPNHKGKVLRQTFEFEVGGKNLEARPPYSMEQVDKPEAQ